MACSKYELGYDKNRFEIVISQRFHCPICFLVLKDPVMCKNEHYYCFFCIKKCLENSSFCPTCHEPLTVHTLKPAPIIVKDYISELNIRCDFHTRGCPEMVQVGHLKRHVASCGFSPVQCSNDGCNVLLNAKDKLHHEAEICDFRKLKCHNCGQLKNEIKDEMNGMKDELSGLKERLKRMKEETKGVKVRIDQVLVSQDQMQSKIVSEIKQEVKDQIRNEMKSQVSDLTMEMKNGIKEMVEKEMKELKVELKDEINRELIKTKEEIKNEIKKMIMSVVRDGMARIKDVDVERKNSKQQSSLATCSSDATKNIFLVGGISVNYTGINFTECFDWAHQTWTLLDSAVFDGRSHLCSFLYQGQMVVAGGHDDDGDMTNTMKCLNVADQLATWKDFDVNLPVRCSGHKVISHNDQLFMSGGWVEVTDMGLPRCSDAVYEEQLVPPYSSKVLTRLPQPRSYHAMEMFDEKLFIFGGYDGRKITASVVQYDLIKNECKEMPPLPYAVTEMVTVLWRNNVLVIGGCDKQNKCLKKVVMYDVITGRSQMLPCMKVKRYGCAAVVAGKVLVVMGGWNAEDKYLKSVESFDLELQVWKDLPDILEPRAFATAVVNLTH